MPTLPLIILNLFVSVDVLYFDCSDTAFTSQHDGAADTFFDFPD